MRRVRRPRRTRLHLRWLFDSWLVGATWVSVLLGAWSMMRVGSALRTAEAIRVESDHELARLAAEAAVAQVPLDAPEGGVWRHLVGGIEVTVELHNDQLSVASRLSAEEVHAFRSTVLRGAAPAMFGRPESNEVPPPDEGALAGATSAEDLSQFRKDSGVALMYFDGGTDLDDFVLEDRHGQFDLVNAGVIVVPGHLWVERGDKPLALHCERDVTIVVWGNLYIGRSIQIAGPGRIVFVTLPGDRARAFADRDGNGRCSAEEAHEPVAGAIEGAASVYLGLADSPSHLAVGAGLVVGGYVHLWRDTAVDGPVMSAHAPVAIGQSKRLTATGQRLFRPQRETVPGFAVAGPARPGLLFEVGGRLNPRSGQALYLTGSAR